MKECEQEVTLTLRIVSEKDVNILEELDKFLGYVTRAEYNSPKCKIDVKQGRYVYGDKEYKYPHV